MIISAKPAQPHQGYAADMEVSFEELGKRNALKTKMSMMTISGSAMARKATQENVVVSILWVVGGNAR